jgi:hypothetical protein
MKRALEIDCTTVCMYLYHWAIHLKMVKKINFRLHLFFYKKRQREKERERERERLTIYTYCWRKLKMMKTLWKVVWQFPKW